MIFFEKPPRWVDKRFWPASLRPPAPCSRIFFKNSSFFYGHENDIPAFQAHPQEATRFPCSHGYQSGTWHPQEPSPQRSEAPTSKGCRDSLQAPYGAKQHQVSWFCPASLVGPHLLTLRFFSSHETDPEKANAPMGRVSNRS